MPSYYRRKRGIRCFYRRSSRLSLLSLFPQFHSSPFVLILSPPFTALLYVMAPGRRHSKLYDALHTLKELEKFSKTTDRQSCNIRRERIRHFVSDNPIPAR
ncbi:hypothetical protein PUN28_012554 [Cardiocondyla obscurior]|uniref:Uncharacterized protein n=1 Tax=Cardiocondyla obscurior TaxID=286306 RepID=A0AAW2FFY3_9HYME